MADPVGGLGLLVNEYGHVSDSIAGVASADSAGGTVTVRKPLGAKVRGAYLAYATTGFSYATLDLPITLDGQPVPLTNETANGIDSYNYFADVTALVKAKLDAAPAGLIGLLVAEPEPGLVDGEILTVIYDDPGVTTNQTVSLLYGALSPTGDSYQVQLSAPIKLSAPETKLTMALGISFSYQEDSAGQYSTVKVNDALMTSSAGGSDDGQPINGGLITVGGEGDSTDNPADPAAAPADALADDELYDLRPFVHDGDTSIKIATDNPSLDDNVFFAAFTMNPPATTIATGGSAYVAMGDSYQAGEGAYDYVDGTDVDGNRCHRSSVSYPFLIQGNTGVPSDLVDVACSGAVIGNLSDGQYGEPAQYDALTDRTALVIIGVGGNDLDFPTVIRACANGPQLSGDFFSVNQTCHGRFDGVVAAKLKALDTRDSSGLTPFERVYSTIRSRAPHARIVVVGYPHFFKPSGNFGGCQLIWRSDEKWMNAKIDEVDAVIQRSAEAMGAEYTGGKAEFDGHELCGDGPEYLNGVVGLGDPESFHPNAAGQQRLADVLLDQLGNHQPTATLTVQQDQTVDYDVVVDKSRAVASFFSTWPGSTVSMQLTDPAGRVITPDSTDPDVLHQAGPTSELYRITTPQAGKWRVALFGTDVQAGGEPVTLSIGQPELPNQLPVAVASHRENRAGTTVTYSARGSVDPDGTIASYEWDFGDGSAATGRTVRHTYSNIGHVNQPTLLVTDDRGGLSFADLPNVKVHYGFHGFLTPVLCRGVGLAKAGSEVKFSWQLTSPNGSPVTDPAVVSAYAFDATGGSAALRFDPKLKRFVATAQTPTSWRGTTHTFVVRLTDNSVHTEAVKFF